MKNTDIVRNMTDGELATLLSDVFIKGAEDVAGKTNINPLKVINSLKKWLQEDNTIFLTCPKCHGEGCYLVRDEENELIEQYCHICDGDGKVTDERYKYYERIKSKGAKK